MYQALGGSKRCIGRNNEKDTLDVCWRNVGPWYILDNQKTTHMRNARTLNSIKNYVICGQAPLKELSQRPQRPLFLVPVTTGIYFRYGTKENLLLILCHGRTQLKGPCDELEVLPHLSDTSPPIACQLSLNCSPTNAFNGLVFEKNLSVCLSI